MIIENEDGTTVVYRKGREPEVRMPKNPEEFDCDECDETFELESELEQHIREEHEE